MCFLFIIFLGVKSSSKSYIILLEWRNSICLDLSKKVSKCNYRYDVVYTNLSQKPEWLIEKSPLGKVPCIEFENGDIMYESLIICEYLDEAYPENKLFPKDPLAKAKDKLLIERFNDVISTMYKVSDNFLVLYIAYEKNKKFIILFI